MRLTVRRSLPCLATLAALTLPAPAMACDAPAAQALPTADTLARAAASTLCLINEERVERGLRPLDADRQLESAARGYAGAMVADGFFSHVSPDGGGLRGRLDAASWIPRSGSWSAGENIAWGSGELGAPQRIVKAWMASPGHRANILNRTFTELGLGIAVGAPDTAAGSGPAATYVVDFGHRSGAAAASRRSKAKDARTRAKRARRATAKRRAAQAHRAKSRTRS